MAEQEFKKGDKVKITDRSTGEIHRYAGDTGTVTMWSGGQYWVKLDKTNDILPALQPWWLEPIS